MLEQIYDHQNKLDMRPDYPHMTHIDVNKLILR